jgi:heat shock protein HslJ
MTATVRKTSAGLIKTLLSRARELLGGGLIFLGAIGGALTGCSPANSSAEFPAGSWSVDTLLLDEIPVKPLNQITLSFDGNIVSGFAGCNTYSATFTTDGNQIAIDGIGSTRMLCREEGIMEQEAQFLGILDSVDSWEVGLDSLTLFGSIGRLNLAPAG